MFGGEKLCLNEINASLKRPITHTHHFLLERVLDGYILFLNSFLQNDIGQKVGSWI